MDVTNQNEIIGWVTTNPEMALVPVALLIGKLVTSSKLDNAYTPLIVVIASAILGFLIAGASTDAAIKGLVASLIAVGAHQGVTQLSKKEPGAEGDTTGDTSTDTEPGSGDPPTGGQ